MLVLVAILSLGVLTACGGGGGSKSAREVEVVMGANGEWKFTPDLVEVTKGETVKFNLVNKDAAQAHSFIVAELNLKSQQVPANTTQSVTHTFDKTGEFALTCDVPGHKDAGMIGKIVVK